MIGRNRILQHLEQGEDGYPEEELPEYEERKNLPVTKEDGDHLRGLCRDYLTTINNDFAESIMEELDDCIRDMKIYSENLLYGLFRKRIGIKQQMIDYIMCEDENERKFYKMTLAHRLKGERFEKKHITELFKELNDQHREFIRDCERGNKNEERKYNN